MRKLLAWGAIYFLWGGSFLAIRELVGAGPGHSLPPFFAAGFRFTLAGLVLLLWTRFSGSIRISGRQFLSAATLGLIMFAFNYAALFRAEIRLPSGLAAVVSATIPIWIYAGELLILRTQRTSPIAIAGITLGFAGVALLALHASGHAAPESPSLSASRLSASTTAVLVIIGGTLCWSSGTLLSRRLPLPVPQQANAGSQMLIGGLLLLALSAGTGELRHLPPASDLLSLRMLLSMGYLIVAASILAYTAYVWLISHESPTRVASYAYVNPVVALLLGALLAGERLTPPQMAGAALVVAGVIATLTGRSLAPAQSMPSAQLAPQEGE